MSTNWHRVLKLGPLATRNPLVFFYWQLQSGRPLSSEHGSPRRGSRAETLPVREQRRQSPLGEFSQELRGEVTKRSPDLTESASNDKVCCQKEKKNFQLGGTMLYPRGVNENKVNAFCSYYLRWRRSHQLCREAERQEIKTASDMWAAMQYKIPLPRKSVRLAFLVMTHKAWWEKNFVPNAVCVRMCTWAERSAPICSHGNLQSMKRTAATAAAAAAVDLNSL